MSTEFTKLEKPTSRMMDLAGMKSGKLTITTIHGFSKYPNGSMITLWNSICECGNSHILNGNKFIRGDIKSCGCTSVSTSDIDRAFDSSKGKVLTKFIIRETRKIDDFTGRTFGKLTVTDLSHGIQYHTMGKYAGKTLMLYWKCLCTCGKTCIRSGRYLRYSDNVHCGCDWKKRKVKLS